MTTKDNKKPNIVIIGVGAAATSVLNKYGSDNENENIKLVCFVNQDGIKRCKNENITVIESSRPVKITMEKLQELCTKYNLLDRLNQMLELMKDGDEIIKLVPWNSSCLQLITWTKIKLKRDGETIDSFELYRYKPRCSKNNEKTNSVIKKLLNYIFKR